MSCELYSYHYTNANFKGNQEELETKFFAEIKALYSSNIVSNLYCCKFIVSAFPGGLNLCTFHELYSYYYTNAIFQENQEELETNFFCRKRQNLLILRSMTT